MSGDNHNNGAMQRLLKIMAALRDPEDGCPWDCAQTFASIVPHTIEEAYEVADAIEHGQPEDIKGELGDLLFQVVFYAQLGKEQGHFDFNDIATAISDKLTRRHPHVFGALKTRDLDQINANWQAIKARERQAQQVAKGEAEDTSILAHIPRGMAPLLRANRLQQQAAKVGFDWGEVGPVVAKIHEEIDEVMAEMSAPTVASEKVEDEIGDLLFAVVNLARHAGVDPERALRGANNKFESRFRAIEARLHKQGQRAEDLSLEELEAHWVAVKKQS